MIVYADILVLVNCIVDFFLISLTARIVGKRTRFWRKLCAAALGGAFSLYIFLPQSPVGIEIIIRGLMSMVISAVAFGFSSIKSFLRAAATFLAVTFFYAGAMIAVWFVFRPHGMVINNSVVYYNVSPTFLIAFSVLGYFITAAVRLLLKKKSGSAKRCTVDVVLGEKNILLDAIIDTGNSLSDAFGMSQVIISEDKTVNFLFGNDLKSEHCLRRYRALPCSTVSGTEILDGYRCDSAVINYGDKTLRVTNPIIAVSKSRLIGCSAILNPKTLE